MSKEDKKLQVLKAASDCFGCYGQEKNTLDNIGKLVGLNKASLYYYFKNKESIFCDVIFRQVDIYLEQLQKKVKTAKPAKKIFNVFSRAIKLLSHGS